MKFVAAVAVILTVALADARSRFPDPSGRWQVPGGSVVEIVRLEEDKSLRPPLKSKCKAKAYHAKMSIELTACDGGICGAASMMRFTCMMLAIPRRSFILECTGWGFRFPMNGKMCRAQVIRADIDGKMLRRSLDIRSARVGGLAKCSDMSRQKFKFPLQAGKWSREGLRKRRRR